MMYLKHTCKGRKSWSERVGTKSFNVWIKGWKFSAENKENKSSVGLKWQNFDVKTQHIANLQNDPKNIQFDLTRKNVTR